ncbi:MAG: hypothetical protein HYY01_09365 [Chloroflexi bacterium]|nr:hypothetical protein [Chloroflexota bacterium]
MPGPGQSEEKRDLFDSTGELKGGYDIAKARANALAHAKKTVGEYVRHGRERHVLLWKVEKATWDEDADCFCITLSAQPDWAEVQQKGIWEYHADVAGNLLPGTPIVQQVLRYTFPSAPKKGRTWLPMLAGVATLAVVGIGGVVLFLGRVPPTSPSSTPPGVAMAPATATAEPEPTGTTVPTRTPRPIQIPVACLTPTLDPTGSSLRQDRDLLQASADGWRTDGGARIGKPWPTVGGFKGALADADSNGVDVGQDSSVIQVSLLVPTYLKSTDAIKSFAHSTGSGTGATNSPVGSYVWYIDTNSVVQARLWTDSNNDSVIDFGELARFNLATEVAFLELGIDGEAVQKAVERFNNDSIVAGRFPDRALATVYATEFGSTPSVNLTTKDKDGNTIALATFIATSGNDRRVGIDFGATTPVWNKDGSIRDVVFVPDLVGEAPECLDLMASESGKKNGMEAVRNIMHEFLWVMRVSGEGKSFESRMVEVYRLTSAADGEGSANAAAVYTQVYPFPE